MSKHSRVNLIEGRETVDKRLLLPNSVSWDETVSLLDDELKQIGTVSNIRRSQYVTSPDTYAIIGDFETELNEDSCPSAAGGSDAISEVVDGVIVFGSFPIGYVMVADKKDWPWA